MIVETIEQTVYLVIRMQVHGPIHQFIRCGATDANGSHAFFYAP